jgi:gliding motility-associated-like protein
VELNAIRPFSPSDAVWSVLNGPSNLVGSNGIFRPANFTADGLYKLILSKTIGTCTDSDTLFVQANQIPSKFFTSSSQAICAGSEIQLSYPGPASYLTTWLKDGSIISTSPTLTLSTAGEYQLIVDNNGCKSDTSQIYEVQPNPTFDFRNADTSSCKNGTPIEFKITNESSGTGKWSGLGMDTTGTWNPGSSQVPNSGPITISYTRTSAFGCKTTKTFVLQVNPIPAIEITITTNLDRKDTIEAFGPAILKASGGFTYSWSPSSTVSPSFGSEVQAKPEKTTEYTVDVATDKGCKGQKSITVVVDEEFKIYDGFSPNNDLRNDVWVIKNIQRFPDATVKVFNRWGNEVFASEKGYPKPWDGKFDGNQVPPGAYYYIIDLGQGFTPKSGAVTILR